MNGLIFGGIALAVLLTLGVIAITMVNTEARKKDLKKVNRKFQESVRTLAEIERLAGQRFVSLDLVGQGLVDDIREAMTRYDQKIMKIEENR